MREFYEYELDGSKVAFHRDNIIMIQIGKGKGSYEDTHTYLAPDFPRAVMHYRCLNIGNGYKKRMVCWDLNKPILARYRS
jgi:hypothetical protein